MTSFLTTNTCPVDSHVGFEKLTFWTLGYGGWLGASLLPVLWSLPVSCAVKTVLSVLMLPTTAMIVTAVFAALYLASFFTYTMASIMISPEFMHSCIWIVCLTVGSIGMYVGNAKRLEIAVTYTPVVEESEAEGSEGEEAESSEGEESEGSEGEESEAEDTESSEDVDNTWRETANFEGLRTAESLPE